MTPNRAGSVLATLYFERPFIWEPIYDLALWHYHVNKMCERRTYRHPAEESSITPGRGEAKRLEEQLRQKGESGTNVCTVFRTLVDANGLSDISGMFFRSSLSSSGGRQNFSGIKKPNCTLYCSDTLREMLWCNITYNTIECPSWCTAGDTHWSNALSLMRRYELFSDWSNLRADWLNKADPYHVFIFCLLFVMMMISLSLAQISVGSDVTETGGLPRSSLLGAV